MAWGNAVYVVVHVIEISVQEMSHRVISSSICTIRKDVGVLGYVSDGKYKVSIKPVFWKLWPAYAVTRFSLRLQFKPRICG